MSTQHDDKQVTFLLSGGGSGGHIRPLLAVAHELKQAAPRSKVVSVGDRGSAFGHLTESHESIDTTYAIFAGKFRRYHGESVLSHILDIRTLLLNIRDVFYVGIGIVQSIFLLARLRPDVVFLKGGFVGVPIGLAAALWRIPMVTHDSDAMPGLANRIVGRWAKVHATGLPADFYTYDHTKVEQVGVLVSRDYAAVDDRQKQAFKAEIGLPEQGRVLLVTGGSLGSRRINVAMATIIQRLLHENPDLCIVHQVGKGNLATYAEFSHPRLHVMEFLDGMHRYSGAADVIVTRAGANNMAEFGVQKKACVVVPSPFLAGGHQLKNADFLVKNDAARVVDETAMQANPEVLLKQISDLLHDKTLCKSLGEKLSSLAIPNAAERLAEVLLQVADEKAR